jgi:hypothetical protein
VGVRIVDFDSVAEEKEPPQEASEENDRSSNGDLVGPESPDHVEDNLEIIGYN